MNIYIIYNPYPNYCISHCVLFMHEQFNLFNIYNGINIFDITKKYNENCLKNNLDIGDRALFKSFIKDEIKYIDNKKNYFIFFGRYFLTNSLVYDLEFIKLLKEKGKVYLWLDDLQKLFSKELLRLSKTTNNNEEISKLLEHNFLEEIDKIITPSIIFFKNFNSKWVNKSIFQFYSINPSWFSNVVSFNERKSKIMLSGYIDSSYKTRNKILQLYNSKKIYKEWIYYHKHPGYIGTVDNDYFKTLQEYKFAFIGLVNYPMNYCVSKIIETLACGTIALIEFSPLLKEELGLIEFKHYIPLYFNSKRPIDFNLIKNLDKNGHKIADNGRNFVLKNFDYKVKMCELLYKLKS